MASNLDKDGGDGGKGVMVVEQSAAQSEGSLVVKEGESDVKTCTEEESITESKTENMS